MSERLKNYLRKYNLLFMLGAVFLIAIIATKGVFIKPSNLIVILARASVFGIITLAQALVIINGEFDLSVGSLVAVSISVIATFNESNSLMIASLMGILVATGIGMVNGLLVAKTRVPSFIITLGTMSIARSISWVMIAGKNVVIHDYQDTIQPIFDSLPGGSNIFPILILGLALLSTGLLLHKSIFGRYLYAIGGNKKTAVASGVPVTRVKIIVFIISGFLCSIAGIVYLYRVAGASPAIGSEFLLQSIAAATIGGVYLYGGEGTIWGIFTGIFTLVSITNILTIAGISPAINQAFLGAIILTVVLFQRWLKRN
jgi:ribose/xylose/arabinose/galactoside ABC-type transport system permease subunit